MRQFTEMADQAVGVELPDRYLGIAEFDPDHRNPGAAGYPNVRASVADHDRGGEGPAGPRHRLPQDGRIGL